MRGPIQLRSTLVRVLPVAVLVAAALLTRFTVLGQTNYFNDEHFYLQVGLRAHDGLLPYVGVWDRKGPGLFLIYWLIGFLPAPQIAYQIVAGAFAAATALTIFHIARHFTTSAGALIGAALYLVASAFLGGAGGQSPIFYNLFMALGALGVVTSLPDLRSGRVPRAAIGGAMLSAGFALTFKQTAACEAAFLGLVVLATLHRAGIGGWRLARIGAGLIVAGLFPFALFAALYALAGHFDAFWQAMVTANLRKTYNPGADAVVRVIALAQLSAVAWVPALIGLFAPARPEAESKGFVLGWLAAAAGGVLLIPNFYEHYLLPACVPLAVAAALAFGWGRVGAIGGVLLLASFLQISGLLDTARAAVARRSMDDLAGAIRQRDPRPRLFVYEGPVDLYRQLGTYPPSPLYFPLHLYFPPEDNVSRIDTAAAVGAILAAHPTVVVAFQGYSAAEENPRTGPVVRGYAARHCRPWFVHKVYEAHAEHWLDVWGDCRPR